MSVVMQEIVNGVMKWHWAQEEAAVREMLGRWVSGLEPALLYRGTKLIGLTLAGIPPGAVAPVVVARKGREFEAETGLYPGAIGA